MKVITVRHMDDVNGLRQYGFNGPLKPGQEELLDSIVQNLTGLLSEKIQVKMLYSSLTRRIKETAEAVQARLLESLSVELLDDPRLESIQRGVLILPENYQDGEWFNPLDEAWEAANDELFLERNPFYRFGDPYHGKYPHLEQSFAEPGNSFGEALMKKFSLITELINTEDELVVVVGQSDLPLLLRELFVLCREMDGVTAENLPYVYWDRYRSHEPKETAYDREGIPFGHVEQFDLSLFSETGMKEIISSAYDNLNKQFKSTK
ncbi:MAG: hypothetical protein AAFQ87_02620 [Bacteroidota bacterium]